MLFYLDLLQIKLLIYIIIIYCKSWNMNKDRDTKLTHISPKVFFETIDYGESLLFKKWNDKGIKGLDNYYYIDDNVLALIYYYTDYDTLFRRFHNDKLYKRQYSFKKMRICYRDGVSEYDVLNKHLEELREKRSQYKRNKKLDSLIEHTTNLLNSLGQNKKKKLVKELPFENYLFNVGIMSTNKDDNNYLVLDVETNGLRPKFDDLLSISIFDPNTGYVYNRDLPLELQPVVLTNFINGITTKSRSKFSPLTQQELNSLMSFFDIKNKTLLVYSGGDGNFDIEFLSNYLNRHNLIGFEYNDMFNIKSFFNISSFGIEGQLSKDNLCKKLGISGIHDIHTSFNDCILEWQLYKKIVDDKIIVIDKNLYKYNNDYIMPVTYYMNNIVQLTRLGYVLPNLSNTIEKIYDYKISSKAGRLIRSFPTNITGIALENGIDYKFNVIKEDNSSFLKNNKDTLEFIDTLDSNIDLIPITKSDDGKIISLISRNDDYVNDVNQVTDVIMQEFSPVIDFIKENIFKDDTIKSQELVLSSDKNILALCDYSDSNSVLELKTTDIFEKDGITLRKDYALQMYYQKNGRNSYLMNIRFETNKIDYSTECFVSIYKINFIK